MSCFPMIDYFYIDLEKDQVLLDLYQAMLNKGAIEPLLEVSTPRLYIRFIIVPNKYNKWRPVIDLSTLNNYFQCPKFKIDSRNHKDLSVSGTMVLVHRSVGHILPHSLSKGPEEVFQAHGRVYQFRAMLFGLKLSTTLQTWISSSRGWL